MNSGNPYEVTPLSRYDKRACDLKVRMVPMRDGKRLHTMIFLPPDAEGPLGTIIMRSPYYNQACLPLPFEFALQYRLAAVFQACRGTSLSEGEWFPSDREVEERDGADLLEWVLKQPWCNGRVALAGSSYSGWTEWTLAYSGNPAITGFRPHVAPLWGCCSMARRGGGSALGFMVSWGLSMYHRTRFGYGNVPDFNKFLDHLPVNEADVANNCGYVEFFRAFVKTTQEPWKAREGVREKFARIAAPALISGGWFDGFKTETLLSFKYMKECAATAEARNFTRLIVGPWAHAGLINQELFGEENDHRELTKLQDRFTLNLLNDPESDPCPEQPAVRFFLMGENRWCSSDVWPPAGREKSLYLGENGALTETPPEERESSSSYTYDPAQPTPSFNGSRLTLGCYDRRETEKRADLLCFTSPVLTKPLRIAGDVKVRLFASSSAPDTDFYATLTDVFPDGRSMYLVCGMVRARFCKTPGKEEFLAPGELREYEIDLSATANTFAPGHAVRLELHSANFPADARNLNTTAPVNEGVAMEKAFQRIFHDREHPSRLILPEVAQEI